MSKALLVDTFDGSLLSQILSGGGGSNDISQLVESINQLKTSVSELNDTVSDLNVNVTNIDQSLSELTTKFLELQQNVDTNSSRLDQTETDLNNLQDRFEDVTQIVNENEQDVADVLILVKEQEDGVKDLQKDMTLVDRALTEMRDEIAAIDTTNYMQINKNYILTSTKKSFVNSAFSYRVPALDSGNNFYNRTFTGRNDDNAYEAPVSSNTSEPWSLIENFNNITVSDNITVKITHGQ